LADWYAVVRCSAPLACRFRKTKIIQSNQIALADKLGSSSRCIPRSAPIESQAAPDRFRLLHRRLAARAQKSDDLARFALRLLPEAFSATESSAC